MYIYIKLYILIFFQIYIIYKFFFFIKYVKHLWILDAQLIYLFIIDNAYAYKLLLIEQEIFIDIMILWSNKYNNDSYVHIQKCYTENLLNAIIREVIDKINQTWNLTHVRMFCQFYSCTTSFINFNLSF